MATETVLQVLHALSTAPEAPEASEVHPTVGPLTVRQVEACRDVASDESQSIEFWPQAEAAALSFVNIKRSVLI